MTAESRYVLRDGVLVPIEQVEAEAARVQADYSGPAKSADHPHAIEPAKPPQQVIRYVGFGQDRNGDRKRDNRSAPRSWDNKRARRYHAVLFDTSVLSRAYQFGTSVEAEDAVPKVRRRFGNRASKMQVNGLELIILWPGYEDPQALNEFVESLGGQQTSHHERDRRLAEAIEWQRELEWQREHGTGG